MAVTIRHKQDAGYIEVSCTGDVDRQQADNAIAEIVRLQEKTGCNILLADLVEMHHAPDQMDLYEVALSYPPYIRTALILPRDSNFDHKFFEDTARNRGRSISSYTDRQAALDWLKEES